MRKPSQFFSEEDRRAVEQAISAAEKNTSGEIVPVVAAASGRYDRAEDIVGFLTALALFSAVWLLFQDIGVAQAWGSGHQLVLRLPVLLAVLAAGFAMGTAVATRFPALKLPFVAKREMEEDVRLAAAAAFQGLGVGRVEGTGVVIYISLLERLVRIEASGAISQKVPQQDWEAVCAGVVEGLRAGRPVPGLLDGIGAAGELLARHFPIRSDDKNELVNKLHLIDESP